MKSEKFENLIKDAFKKSKDGNLVGILYGAVSTYDFSELTDIEEFCKNSNPDMLYLKSKPTDTEINVYKWELDNYVNKNSESTIYIKLKNKPEIALMY